MQSCNIDTEGQKIFLQNHIVQNQVQSFPLYIIHLFFCSLVLNIINRLIQLVEYFRRKIIQCLRRFKIYFYLFDTVNVSNQVSFCAFHKQLLQRSFNHNP